MWTRREYLKATLIRVRKGQRVRINFDNGLDEASNILKNKPRNCQPANTTCL